MFGLVAGAQAPDLVVEVGLAVEPGARDAGGIGDGFEGDLGPGAVEFVQGGEGLGASVFVTASGCGADVNAVVRVHILLLPVIRGVVEDAAHDLLRDVAVDQSSAESVTPLVRREMHSVAVLVTDVAVGQPTL